MLGGVGGGGVEWWWRGLEVPSPNLLVLLLHMHNIPPGLQMPFASQLLSVFSQGSLGQKMLIVICECLFKKHRFLPHPTPHALTNKHLSLSLTTTKNANNAQCFAQALKLIGCFGAIVLLFDLR